MIAHKQSLPFFMKAELCMYTRIIVNGKQLHKTSTSLELLLLPGKAHINEKTMASDGYRAHQICIRRCEINF